MSYDRAGNPNDSGAAVTAGNRLTTFNGFTMTYDADGNMLTRVGPGGANDTYVWDDFGQLKSVTRSGVAQPTTFAYDGFGRRIRKTSAGGTIHYIWDRDQIFAEVDSSGVTLQTYSYNPGVDQPRSVSAGGEVYFMSTGLGGDVNGLIRRSDNAVVAQYTYTPWGGFDAPDQPLVGTRRVNSFRWRGLVYDSETGLYQVRARYYDPATRRFISEDPMGLESGINQYAYGQNDPMNSKDPSGLDACFYRTVSRYQGGVYIGTTTTYVACPVVGNSILDSPWEDPTSWGGTISTAAVEWTKAKIAAALEVAATAGGGPTYRQEMNATLSCAEEWYGAEGLAQVFFAVLGAPVVSKARGAGYMGGSSANKTVASWIFERLGNPRMPKVPAPNNPTFGFKYSSAIGSSRIGGVVGRASYLITVGGATMDAIGIAECTHDVLAGRGR